jgi:hypothetical protein
MNREEFIQEVNQIIEMEDKFDESGKHIAILFGEHGENDNVFNEHFYNMRDKAISLLSICVGDTDSWISWYIEGIDSFEEGLMFSIDNVDHSCKNAGDLYDLIQERCV